VCPTSTGNPAPNPEEFCGFFFQELALSDGEALRVTGSLIWNIPPE